MRARALSALFATTAICPVVAFAQVPIGNLPKFGVDTTGQHIQDSGVPYTSVVIGPATTTANEFAIWNNTTGNLTKNGADQSIVHTHAWPGSFGATPTNGVTYQFGTAWAAATQIPAGVLQGSLVTMTIPATYTQAPWPNTPYAAYCDNQNTSASGNSCVPYFSVSLANGNAQTTAYGSNPIISNTDTTHYFTGATFGKDFGALFGVECNPNVWTKAAGATPAGAVRCFEAVGGGNVIPSGGATAYHVSAYASGLPWTTGFETADGGATAGIILGAAGAPGATVSSQGINFRSYNNASAAKTAVISANPDGASIDLDLNAVDANAKVRFQTNSSTQYYVDGTGFIGASAALATNATGPFIYLNTTAGVPTGVPTNSGAGHAAVIIDTTNHKICWQENGVGWKCALGS